MPPGTRAGRLRRRGTRGRPARSVRRRRGGGRARVDRRQPLEPAAPAARLRADPRAPEGLPGLLRHDRPALGDREARRPRHLLRPGARLRARRVPGGPRGHRPLPARRVVRRRADRLRAVRHLDRRVPRLGHARRPRPPARAAPERGLGDDPGRNRAGAAPRRLPRDDLLAPQGLERAGSTRTARSWCSRRRKKRPPPPYVDSYLTDLEQLGVFDAAAALVVARPYGYAADQSERLWEVVARRTEAPGIPVLANVEAGHTDPMVTLPFGVPAEVDAARRTLRLLEVATSD